MRLQLFVNYFASVYGLPVFRVQISVVYQNSDRRALPLYEL